eukprot:1378584-Alexandrium_andersonii.AAC.1
MLGAPWGSNAKDGAGKQHIGPRSQPAIEPSRRGSQGGRRPCSAETPWRDPKMRAVKPSSRTYDG